MSKPIMPFLGHLSAASAPDLQNLMFFPWELPKIWELPEKVLEFALLFLWRPQPYPSPKFKIGDLVADDWVDEFGEDATDFGEVRGICYLPEEYFDCPANTWVYFIYWTRTTCGLDTHYPCFNGEPTKGDRLRLVKQS
jgi:hypothetical protein